MDAISIENLTKDYRLPEKGRYLRAVDALNLSIEPGTVFGLLGPNGSGKSTTIKLILGLAKPSQGRCLVFGKSAAEPANRRRIGYVPDAPYYYRFLSGLELMLFYARLLGIPRSAREKRCRELLERFGIADAAGRKLGGYSKGMLQRLGFAQALLDDPDVLILDEPTAGVDPVGAAEVGEYVLEWKRQGKTVLLCSHLLAQVQDVCDRVGIMNKGRLLAEGAVDSLLARDSEVAGLQISGLQRADRAAVEELARERGGAVRSCGYSLDELFRELVKEDET